MPQHTRAALTAVVLAALALTSACGAPASTGAQPTISAPAEAATYPETVEQDIDPATVTVTACKFVTETYDGYAPTTYSVESVLRATNTTGLTGTLNLAVQYQNRDGEVITEDLPGANHIKPGQKARITSSVAVEKADFPGKAVKCVVVAASTYRYDG